MASKPVLASATLATDPAPAPRPNRANWLVFGFALVLLISLTALAYTLVPNLRPQPSQSAGDAALSLEQRMILIAERLQCPVCQGQSVAFSNSPLAAEMRRQIREKLQAGASEQQITQYFIDRYGVRILREPPRTGLHLWLWLTPATGLGVGLLWLVWRLRQMAQTRRPQPAEAPGEQTTTLADPEIHELLVRYDKDLFT